MLTKKTAKKRSAQAPTETVVFEKHNLTVCKTWDGNYSFDMPKTLCSTDAMEAVAYLMKQPQFANAAFWSFPVNTTAEISTVKALYWLSGGDEMWKNPLYTVNWVKSFPLFLAYFHDRIHAAYSGATLGDIRRNIEQRLRLDEFFEFALNNHIL